MPTLDDIQNDAIGCTEYIESMTQMYRGGFLRQKQEYSPKQEILDRLKTYSNDFTIVAVFADWCGDARRAIPVLALVEEYTGKKITALGGMTKPSYGSSKFWAVPPSPQEVDTFEITSSPTILIFNKEGKEIGRIKTKQKMTPTIEEEVLKIIEDSLVSK
ncbi:MAG: thioredoxin family protein [Candidatus Thorarchaeota archaeon]|nr:thioredoxin family protein [Candidatus Thorarchaeota archaeon]